MRITFNVAESSPEGLNRFGAKLESMGFTIIPVGKVKDGLLFDAYKKDTDPTDLIVAKAQMAANGVKFIEVTGDNLPEFEQDATQQPPPLQ